MGCCSKSDSKESVRFNLGKERKRGGSLKKKIIEGIEGCKQEQVGVKAL